MAIHLSPPCAQVHEVKEAIASHKHGAVDRRVWPIAASTMLMGTAIGVVLPVMPMFARELGLRYLCNVRLICRFGHAWPVFTGLTLHTRCPYK